MKKLIILLILFISCRGTDQKNNTDFTTKFELSNGTETATYQETIQFYTNLASKYTEISIDSIGTTDSGKPLHIVTFNPDQEFNFNEIRKNKRILLINNGIHPGESDGIDATMILFRDLAQKKIKKPEHTVVVSIPIYNIGGSLNRNSTTRTNQNGPKEYGFRGNSRNYDLNRDFIKCDTKNAKSFTKIFHLIKPDMFVDNHVSNGADYQYTLTHLFTQHNKLGGNLGNYVYNDLRPSLERKLTKKHWDITPYVNVFNSTPENGFSQFMDYPRYSSGYAALFSTFGMMVETHMLKPYKKRVEGNLELMKSIIEIIDQDHEKIKNLKTDNYKNIINNKKYTINWTLDSLKKSTFNFKGYKAQFIQSTITGQPRLKYDRMKPFTKKINYFNFYKPAKKIDIPKAYIIPQGWFNVIDLLQLNDVEMNRLTKDTTIIVDSYKIESYATRKKPYEGHYQHFNTTVRARHEPVIFRRGDYYIKMDQPSVRYIIETLEPEASDSFFNWNFFDTILQQKEGFSPYVWEDKAEDILKNNRDLKLKFENKKKTDLMFEKNWYDQLAWIHKHSIYHEKSHLQYPVYRVN
jgi:hypothetical protein